MLMDWDQVCVKYDFAKKVTGILHVGGHICEEADRYAQLDVPVWWVEANPNLYDEIEEVLAPYPDQQLIRALVSDEDDKEMTLHISGPGYRGSSSVLEWGSHRTFSPLTWVDHITLRSCTIDTLIAENEITDVNMLCMDIQGAEMLALEGATDLIPQLDFVMSEVNDADVYIDCAKVWEMDEVLKDFDRVETKWVGDQHWGDSLWTRR